MQVVHILIVDLFGGLKTGVELAIVQQLLVLGLEQGVAIGIQVSNPRYKEILVACARRCNLPYARLRENEKRHVEQIEELPLRFPKELSSKGVSKARKGEL